MANMEHFFTSNSSGRLLDEDLKGSLDFQNDLELDYLLGLHVETIHPTSLATTAETGTSFEDVARSYQANTPLEVSSLALNADMGGLDFSTFDLPDSNDFAGSPPRPGAQQPEGGAATTTDDTFEAFTLGGGDFMLFDLNMDVDFDLSLEPDLSLSKFTPSHDSSIQSSSDNLNSLAGASNHSWGNHQVVYPTPVSSSATVSTRSNNDDLVKRRHGQTTNQIPSSMRRDEQVGEEAKWIFVNTNHPQSKASPRSGVRRGHLPVKTRKKARRIREIGACWKCWVQKVPCSEGAPCQTCVKHFSTMAPELCWRTRLAELTPVFFPEYLNRHLEKSAVAEFIENNLQYFTGNTFDMELSVGRAFEPMTVEVQLFRPRTWELIGQYHFLTEQGESRLVERYSAPLGIKGMSIAEMKTKSRKYIEEMLASPHYAAQVTSSHQTNIPRHLLEVVKRYDASMKNNSLVHDTLLLHGIHYFMSVLPTFSAESRNNIDQEIDHLGAPTGEYLTSRLLNRQLKHVMQSLHQDVYQRVLEGLEKSLRSSGRTESWSSSFSTLLILCLCMEELQIAAEIFVKSDMELNRDSEYTRQTSTATCMEVEKGPFQQCMRLFHDVYRSGSGRVAASRDGGLNPFRKIGEQRAMNVLDDDSNELVRRIQALMGDHHQEMLELASRPTIRSDQDLKSTQIKLHNTGRIASKFLVSFLDTSTP